MQKGQRMSEKQKEKISNSNKGRKRPDLAGKKNYFFGKHFRGKDCPNWKSGIRKSGGYIFIHKPTHPFKDYWGYVKKSRLIAEKYLKRYLEPSEIPHHINLNPSDDRPENLFVFENRGYHCQFHVYFNKNSVLKNFLDSNLV